MNMIIESSKGRADGTCFDDIRELSLDLLVSRGLVFLTEFQANGKRYGGTIIASSPEHAATIAFGRGLDEEVIGRLIHAV
ncbi:hypothetical protein [Aquibium oceanicum]|uniref:Uncharacterized protein n=1 Tax=Aquibium oceanicum TaxID=1670800 RepID=A0A1L3SXJ4_9HYPH|nr:hypothetical protein [Aquibium oceanicum]APH74139.1 hypothetical protein BSQ44_24280 [Aquibium oceanicum]